MVLALNGTAIVVVEKVYRAACRQRRFARSMGQIATVLVGIAMVTKDHIPADGGRHVSTGVIYRAVLHHVRVGQELTGIR